MREQTSSFEVARTVTELSKMIGSRIRKAYQPHYEQVVLRMSKKGHANTDLVIVRGKRVYNSTRDRPICLLYTSPSPRDKRQSRMPSSA